MTEREETFEEEFRVPKEEDPTVVPEDYTEAYQGESGVLNSVFPPTEYLTFGPWIYMVPQYKPTSVLMLGYAEGTVAGLIRLLYGRVPITGVDLVPPRKDYYGINFVQVSAEDYVKRAPATDAVIVDVYADGSYEPPPFVTSAEFVANLERIARYIIVHTSEKTDMSSYSHLRLVRTIEVPYDGSVISKFYYYTTERIPELPIR